MSREIMKAAIEKAQHEIDEKREAVRNGVHRQKYHFMAETGWINDPNGLIYYKGKYHVFYQYNPYRGFWDAMHWGHAVSEDLLHWEYLPLALAPSETYDDHPQGGCFSGSAAIYDDKLYILYTGTCNNGNGFVQTQNLAYSEDGIRFEKYEGNPVIDVPEGIPGDFFRDPYMWKHGDLFYVVIGANKEGRGQAMLYRSANLTDWEFVNVLAESRGEWGFMWECPCFFELDGKYVLIISPMGDGDRTSVYMVGDFSYETGKFFIERTGETDWGFHYYAPQAMKDDKGRTILIAWANAWDWMPFWKDWGPAYREGWCGTYNIPREVLLNEDLTLSFRPIGELESLRTDGRSAEGISAGENPVSVREGFCYEIRAEVNLEKTDAKQFSFVLREKGAQRTVITYDLANGEIRFDCNESDGWSKGIARAPLNLIGAKTMDIHILSDRSSIEVFSKNYTVNLSCNVYTTEEKESNTVTAEGGSVYFNRMESWNLEQSI